MYLAIIVLPLLGSIAAGFFGRLIGVKGAQIITCSCIITSMILSWVAFVEVALNNIPVHINIMKWLDVGLIDIKWSFNFDALTVSMLLPVLIISALVHIYSIGYMSHDCHQQRFFSYLSLFTFMMLLLVSGDNFLIMFTGWEGVGVASYLLVSFWFTRVAANQSSLSAFLTNRVGDMFLTIGMFAMLSVFGNLDYTTVFSLSPYINSDVITIIGICLLIGAMAKSAQLGLHVWLPLAMEGPTPVSALIHAATMVTAGVYLLIRCSPMLEYSSTVLLACIWLGSVTTLTSSMIGLWQQDIKKVIAYSTMSQLGLMVISIGLSSYNIALFHLINHAFYKGLLFLAAGSVIHSILDSQELRKYGGLIKYIPLTYSAMLIGSVSLMALPYMTGFYSKDFIIESSYGIYKFSGMYAFVIAIIGAGFTTLYSVKVIYLTFLAFPSGPLKGYQNAHESGIAMLIPLIVLTIFSIGFGYLTSDLFIGIGTRAFTDNSIYAVSKSDGMIDTEFGIASWVKLIPLVLTLALTFTGLIVMEYGPKWIVSIKSTKLGYNLYNFFSMKFLVDMVYNKAIVSTNLAFGGQTTSWLDKGSIEWLGPKGLEEGLLSWSRILSRLDTGVVTTYALYILMGLIFYITIAFMFDADMGLVTLVIGQLLVFKLLYNDKL